MDQQVETDGVGVTSISENLPRTIVHTYAEMELGAGAKAEILSWSPNPRKAYAAVWKDLTKWCLEDRLRVIPQLRATSGITWAHPVELQGRTLAAARPRLAAVSALSVRFEVEAQQET